MDIMTNTNPKKERVKLNPEQLYEIYLECNAPGAPVKTILERYGLKPWDLVAIRKKVKTAAMETLANPGKPGRRQQTVSVEQHQKVSKELTETKDALSAVGHELALLKKDALGLKGSLNGHFKPEIKKNCGQYYQRIHCRRRWPKNSLRNIRDSSQEIPQVGAF
ncbi:MAG TPA: hypothetical protein ENN78_01215 [Candidatus Omnitrophica bacterium]|nr:hypothetical protein [Candidatus Omnitrophota bacterium]